jgi:transposase
MHSMKQPDTLVVGGVDAHADSHHAAALDERGVLLATKSFPTTRRGYGALLDWLRDFGALDVVAVESTGSYAAALVRYLREHDVGVLEVNQPHEHTRRRRGKSDPIDAEMAARLALAGKATSVPKQTDGIVESIRMLRVARESAVKSRSAAMLQLGGLIINAPQELRDQLSGRTTLRGKASLARRWRASTEELDRPTQAAKFALRSIARRIEILDDEIAVLDRRLDQLVRAAAPRTTQLLGISTGHAGQLLVTAGQNIERLRGEAAFAALCGASPVPVSSGKRTRHRLNYGGDRQANRALHLIAVCRLRYCQRTRAYARRRTAEGKTKPEIMRCLKRYIAREVYNRCSLTSLPSTLRDDRSAPPPSFVVPARSEPPGAALDIYRNVPRRARWVRSQGGPRTPTCPSLSAPARRGAPAPPRSASPRRRSRT